jgi:predicted nuclease of predicted toxin-antitoxin system
MHIKLDENSDPRWRVPLEDAGNSVSTVAEEKLQGKADDTIAAICRSLDMCLLTLDLDFAQTTAYYTVNLVITDKNLYPSGRRSTLTGGDYAKTLPGYTGSR